MPTVKIVKVGDSWIMCSIGDRWDSFFAAGPHVSDDLLAERDQGEFEEREPL